MTQFDTTMPEDDDEHDSDETQEPGDLRRKLRAANRQVKELSDQAAALQGLQKENVFLKVALPDTPVTRLFRDTYTGDLNEDAIRAGATELGILQSEADASQHDVDAIAGQSNALVGSQPSMTPDSQEAMWKEFTDVLQQGGNGEEILRKYGHRVASDDR